MITYWKEKENYSESKPLQSELRILQDKRSLVIRYLGKQSIGVRAN